MIQLDLAMAGTEGLSSVQFCRFLVRRPVLANKKSLLMLLILVNADTINSPKKKKFLKIRKLGHLTTHLVSMSCFAASLVKLRIQVILNLDT